VTGRPFRRSRANASRAARVLGATALLLFLAPAVRSEDVNPAEKKPSPSWLALRLSEHDVYLPVSSVEWGIPDRWSLTTRYVHMFTEDRDHAEWVNCFTATLAPGSGGARLGAGYHAVYTPRSILGEARIVFLRTWGDPLETDAGRTFAGVELRVSVTGVVNVGAGYYRRIAGAESRSDSFWGYHVGVGM
jgi:hypothetical protein